MATFDLRDRSPRDAYQLVTRLVVPRPIALVSSLSAAGTGNLAPFSYFMMGGSNPPSCIICPVHDRHGEPKDTLRNLRERGEYVINLCTRAMAEAVSQCSYPYDRSVDEFEPSGLTRTESQVVAPPRVAESPIALECVRHQIVGHGDGPLASNYVIGEILYAHVADELLVDGLPDNRKMDLIGRLGADFYAHLTAGTLFELGRPSRG
ncbi:MAG: flavin reductase family protein [Deltaproteobacteria bacterium]|jgi:flavin reductase (DIM6/NTAB) family NADH-FMN oxidoreductase RutF|nr:flavin reductase family protein [Deltaproteobacteria bacterium]MBW2537650.1 flavin reductase family protein [Deltaproteobacteria bacterium]